MCKVVEFLFVKTSIMKMYGIGFLDALENSVFSKKLVFLKSNVFEKTAHTPLCAFIYAQSPTTKWPSVNSNL